LTEPGTVNTLS